MPQFASYYRLWIGDTTNAKVNAGGNIVSPVLDLRWGDRTAWVLEMKAASAGGTADVKVEVASSPDGVTFDNYLTSLTASTNTQFAATPEDYHTYPMDLNGAPYCKIKITGVNANPADTLILATLNFVESFPAENQYAMISRYWDDAI